MSRLILRLTGERLCKMLTEITDANLVGKLEKVAYSRPCYSTSKRYAARAAQSFEPARAGLLSLPDLRSHFEVYPDAYFRVCIEGEPALIDHIAAFADRTQVRFIRPSPSEWNAAQYGVPTNCYSQRQLDARLSYGNHDLVEIDFATDSYADESDDTCSLDADTDREHLVSIVSDKQNKIFKIRVNGQSIFERDPWDYCGHTDASDQELFSQRLFRTPFPDLNLFLKR